MKPETIIKKIIEKVRGNGYQTPWKKRYDSNSFFKKMQYKGNYEAVIFSPDFAKALWTNTNGIVEFNEGGGGLGFLIYGSWSGECKDCGFKFKGKKEVEKMRFGHKGCPIGHEVWQYRQKELLEEIQGGRNPIKYLEQFL